MPFPNLPTPRRLSWVASVLVALAPFAAHADDCADISGGEPIIYGAGGSAQRDLVGRAATILQSSTNPIYVVYKDDAGACSGINALTGLASPQITGTGYYWDATGARKTCNLDISGNTVNFAVMGVGPLQCPLVTDPSIVDGVTEVTGPISSYAVIVPNASTQQSISAEAFYLIYGFGPDADVAPWNNPDPAYYLKRDENSAAQIVLSVATGLPVTKFYGTDTTSNSNTVAYLAALANPEQGLGFVSSDVADANRATVRTLAWQQFDQIAGYWPDSSATAYDKVNVRNGQYHLWNPTHFFGIQGASEGSFADANVKVLLDYLSGAAQPAGTTQTITETAVLNHNVPVCAMNVARDGDLGPVYAVESPEPCGCYFEFASTGATSCDACDDANPCSGSNVCRFGFCEEH